MSQEKNEKVLVALEERFNRALNHVSAFWDERTREFVVGGKRYPAVEKVDGVKKETWFETVLGKGEGQTPMILSTREAVPIRHGDILKGEAGEMILQMAIDQGYVVKKKEDAGFKPLARYTVKDDSAEARTQVSKATQVRKALNLVSELPGLMDKRELAWALRQPVKNMSDDQVDGILCALAMSDPKLVLDALEGRNFKHIAMLQKMVGYGVVEKTGAQYRFGQGDQKEVLGVDETAAIAFLKNKKNKTATEQLLHKLHLASNGTAGAEEAAIASEDEVDEIPFEELKD